MQGFWFGQFRRPVPSFSVFSHHKARGFQVSEGQQTASIFRNVVFSDPGNVEEGVYDQTAATTQTRVAAKVAATRSQEARVFLN